MKFSNILQEFISMCVRGQPPCGWPNDPGYHRRVQAQDEWDERFAELKRIIDTTIEGTDKDVRF